MQAIDPKEHDAPLVELVARLGGGRSLRERVIALRYRRKRPSAGQAGGAVASGCSAAIEGRPDPLGGDGNDAVAGGDNVNNNKSEVECV